MNRRKMESGTEREIGSPRGKSGLILLGTRSASALYLHRNLHAGWGIQLGDTESPCVSPSVTPCVSPRCRRIGHHVLVLHTVCGYRMWWCPTWAMCFGRLRTCRVARAGRQRPKTCLPRCKKRLGIRARLAAQTAIGCRSSVGDR